MSAQHRGWISRILYKMSAAAAVSPSTGMLVVIEPQHRLHESSWLTPTQYAQWYYLPAALAPKTSTARKQLLQLYALSYDREGKPLDAHTTYPFRLVNSPYLRLDEPCSVYRLYDWYERSSSSGTRAAPL